MKDVDEKKAISNILKNITVNTKEQCIGIFNNFTMNTKILCFLPSDDKNDINIEIGNKILNLLTEKLFNYDNKEELIKT
jgi:hypothetical protein